MIDTHVHLWRIGQNDCTWPTAAEAAIHRDVEPAELAATLAEAGVARALLVQSQESPRDTAWLMTHGLPLVGWADLRVADDVKTLAANPLIRGLRPMVQGREADWYDDPALDAGLAAMAEAGLVLDALIRPRHLPALDRLAARHPTLAIVIDHGAKPDIAGDGFEAWHAALAPLASRPNVHIKLSGLLTEKAADQPADAVRPYAEAMLALFGADRVIWGSDWPVVTLAGDYAGWLAQACDLVPADHHDAVFGGNAARIYRLEAA
jgi:L-fuconolactonase